MPASQAYLPTDRARRYLAQLCNHGSQMSLRTLHARRGHGHDGEGEGGGPPKPLRAEAFGTEGIIDFGWARCLLRATDDALVLRAEADDEQQLRRVQDAVAHRLRQIGRRDRLGVTWTPAEPDKSAAADASTLPDAAAILDALMTPAGRADPYPLYARAHRLGALAAIADGWYLVAGYTAVNQVLRDPGFALPDPPDDEPADADRDERQAPRAMSRSILRANPPDHGRMRSLISQVFTPRRIATLRPAIEQAVDPLLDQLAEADADGAPIDFMDAFAFPLPVTVICELLGVPQADRRRFRPLAADLTEALELSGATPISQSADAAARELADYFTALAAQRRARPTDDLIGALVAARDADESRLSETELLANLIMLLVAGFETATNLLGNGLAILLDRPETATALRCGGLEVSGFIEETLRYDCPVQVVTRVARAEDLTVADRPVPRGSQTILLIGAANRDPARYPDPDRFDPARTDTKPLVSEPGRTSASATAWPGWRRPSPFPDCSPTSQDCRQRPAPVLCAEIASSCVAMRHCPSC